MDIETTHPLNPNTVRDTTPARIEDDPRVTRMLEDHWRFHGNYEPREEGDLERTMRLSESVYFRPKNAREVMIIDAAYSVDGSRIPHMNAIYMRDFRRLE